MDAKRSVQDTEKTELVICEYTYSVQETHNAGKLHGLHSQTKVTSVESMRKPPESLQDSCFPLIIAWVDTVFFYSLGRSQRVIIVGSTSSSRCLKYSVPQGSILRPLQFIFHIAPLPDAILDYNLNCLFYVGDSQVNISLERTRGGGGGGGRGQTIKHQFLTSSVAVHLPLARILREVQ